MYFPFIVDTRMTSFSNIMGKCLFRNIIWYIMTVLFQFLLCEVCDENRSKLSSTLEQCQIIYDCLYSQNFVITNQTNIPLLINDFSINVDSSQRSNCTIKEFCKALTSLSLIHFDQNKNDYEKYDGMSEDDIVRGQYKLLPYPPVPEQELKQEEKFYSENSFKMYHNIHVLDLESLNHYLYRGQNDFR